MRRDLRGGRRRGKGRAARRRHAAVGAGPQQQRRHVPLWRAGQRCDASVAHEAHQARCDAVVHQRVVDVGLNHRRVAADCRRLQAVADAQVGRQRVQHGQQRALQRIHAKVQRRRTEHQAVQRPRPVGGRARQRFGHKPRRHRAAHAVAQQHMQAACRVSAHRVDHRRQIGQQAQARWHSAARSFTAAMSALVVPHHMPTRRVQHLRDSGIAADVFTQAMHDLHRATRLAWFFLQHGPALQEELGAVCGRDVAGHGWVREAAVAQSVKS